jgi:hypothetical protein
MMMIRFLLLSFFLWHISLTASEVTVQLRAPLITLVPIESWSPQRIGTIEADIVIPADAPSDLGIGAFVTDHGGVWHQRVSAGKLTAGEHRLSWSFAQQDPVTNPFAGSDWASRANLAIWQAGIFLWSAESSQVKITIRKLRATGPEAKSVEIQPRLTVQFLDAFDPVQGVCRLQTGKLWQAEFLPSPLPTHVFEPALFQVTAVVTSSHGTTQTIPAYFDRPTRLIDRGDQETWEETGKGRWCLRLRLAKSGRYTVKLRAVWNGGTEAYGAGFSLPKNLRAGTPQVLEQSLPDLVVEGPEVDDLVRIDPVDPRYFSLGGKMFWPVGLNLRSPTDPRGQERTPCIATPDRGFATYDAYFRRLKAGGGNTAEVWLSSWNMALEWRAGWEGYQGLDGYHLGHAQRFDAVLRLAEELGLRLIVVLNNHGQASRNVDSEWRHNPYSNLQGGPLDHQREVFMDPEARRLQERLRRYLVARYADSPAILCWKLWTEINLTEASMEEHHSWLQHAAARWKTLDVYDHPIALHWSNNYTRVYPFAIQEPEPDILLLDAYHSRDQPDMRNMVFAQVLWDGVATEHPGLRVGFSTAPHPPKNAAAPFKPIMVTEYGGYWNAAPEPQLLAEHLSGPWAALVSGYAGSPLLWWFEWVDQKNLWSPYRAINRFVDGEDLRSRPDSPSRSVLLSCKSQQALMARAWSRPGRVLGYILDRSWGFDGERAPLIENAQCQVTEKSMDPCKLGLSWWDASTGECLQTKVFEHSGGQLNIPIPPFRRHIAFKLWREK